ncbi:hypothetical protein [Paraburkholderia acidisoli]|uniref:Uncharacterized protein n=1 Tax=Paraburkholderia acidisoli TaxID=2571748 RepID=A0A7Z2GLU3_9BURK|nr:hypothetical protein [Paraburkholderia acidisoli]QGZ63895.1 hypothetical protein FAZ98_19300 [Paraburkholderia acidisoli]
MPGRVERYGGTAKRGETGRARRNLLEHDRSGLADTLKLLVFQMFTSLHAVSDAELSIRLWILDIHFEADRIQFRRAKILTTIFFVG